MKWFDIRPGARRGISPAPGRAATQSSRRFETTHLPAVIRVIGFSQAMIALSQTTTVVHTGTSRPATCAAPVRAAPHVSADYVVSRPVHRGGHQTRLVMPGEFA
jgi:hypothetical protein